MDAAGPRGTVEDPIVSREHGNGADSDASGSSSTGQSASDSSSTSQRGGPHVLLVEDNPGDIRLVTDAFEESGVENALTTVTDGEDALDYLHQRGEYDAATRPDLVLLDLNVPKVNGKEILETIRDEPALESIPVLVLSGSEAPDDVHATYELGADGYVVKPVDPTEFIDRIETIAESVATSAQLPSGKFADIEHSS